MPLASFHHRRRLGAQGRPVGSGSGATAPPVTGQDGAYLAELLLDKGYEVHGIKRRASLFNTDRIDHAPERQADELERMLAGLSSAVGHYAHHLPEVHPDPEARTAWAHRLSGALLDGSLLRTLWPEWFSGDRGRRHGRRAAQDGGGAGAGAGGDDADADADADDRPGPDGPHGDPHDAPLGAFLPPDEAPDDDPAAEPAPDEPDGDEPDPDLLDAILNPPPGHDRP